MFTGIVRAVGRVLAVGPAGAARELAIDAGSLAARPWSEGDSLCVDGVCLTLTGVRPDSLTMHVSAETAACTTLGAIAAGTGVNLEPALAVGDALGGHWVTGHVDGVAQVVAAAGSSGSLQLEIEAPAALMRFIAAKGSVALDGVSLTVNRADGRRFSVNVVPYTLGATTLGAARPGRALNLEVDVLARYAARLLEEGRGHGSGT